MTGTKVMISLILSALTLVSVQDSLSYNIKNYSSPITDRSPDKLHLVSFNAWALPVWIPKSDQKMRYKRIPSKLLATEADIICIQEAFAKKFRKTILPALYNDYYTYSNYRCNKSIAGPVVKDCHGGLMTFSKYPIINERFFEYPVHNNMRIEERIGEKGFLVSSIKIESETIYIINTHLYAGLNYEDELRRVEQIQYLNDVLSQLHPNNSKDIFLLGDLNIRHPDVAQKRKEPISIVYDYIIKQMKFVDTAPSITSEDLTVDKSKNHYCGDSNGSQKLDYCLYRSAHNEKHSIISTEVLFKGEESISDHMAWSVVIDSKPPSLVQEVLPKGDLSPMTKRSIQNINCQE